MSPRRANGEGTRPKEHPKGGYYSHLRVRYADGTRARETLYGKTAGEVRRKLAERRAELDRAGTVRRRDHTTVAEFLERWLRDVVKDRRVKTRRAYAGAVRNHLIPALGNVELRSLSTRTIQEKIAGLRPLVRERKDGAPIERAGDFTRTRAAVLDIFTNALDFAVRWDLLERNPAKLVDGPGLAQHEMRFYLPAQVDRLLAARGDDRLGALYACAIFTGMRSGEILGLQWSDVDLRARTIRVLRQLNDETMTLEPPKTPSAVRTIDISPSLAAELLAHRKRMLAERHPHGFVFCNTAGKALSASNLAERSWRPLKRAAFAQDGVLDRRLDIRFHDLRHTAATLMFAANVPVIVVSRRMGHASPDYTLRLYGHLIPTLQTVAETVERFIETHRAASAT